MLVVSGACKDMRLRKLPEEKDISFKGEVKGSKKSPYLPKQTRDIQLQYSADTSNQKAISLLLGAGAAQNLPTYQATGALSERSRKTIILTIHNEDNQPQTNQSSIFNIENVKWTNGVKGDVHLVSQLKVGRNKLHFDIYDYSELQFGQQPELMLTLGGPDRESKEITINMDDAIAIKRIEDEVARQKEGKRILKEFRNVLRMPTERLEDKDTKKEKLESLFPQAEFLLSLLERDIEVIDRHMVQSKEEQTKLGLAGLNLGPGKDLAKDKRDKEKMRDEVRSKIKAAQAQALVIERAEPNATAAMFNALQSGDQEATEVLLHDPALNLGMVPDKGSTLLQEAMAQGDTTVTKTLKEKGADPNITDKFGAAKWKKYFGEVGSEPPIPEHISALLNQPCQLFPGKKVYETHLLTLIPATVNGEPLTLNSFKRLLENPREGGHGGKYSSFYNAHKPAVIEFGDKHYEASHWVLMTRDLIPGSRSQNYAYQKQFIENTANRLSIPYTLTSVLEGVVSTMCHHMVTGEKLFKGPSTTLSRCREVLSRRPRGQALTVVFGNLTEDGIQVYDISDSELSIAGVAAAVR